MNASPCSILIIEDSSTDQEFYRRRLLADSSYSYRFFWAETAIEGLNLCRAQAIDAILLNDSLSNGDGLTFLRSLQAQSNGSSPPVVVVGQGNESTVVRAIKLGAEDYLVKRQITPTLLHSTLQSAIENGRLRRQLQQSNDCFRVSIENMLDCFGIYSAIRNNAGHIVDFRIDYLNAAALAANRMTPADLGKNLCELLPNHRNAGLFEDYCRVVETGEPLIKEDLVYSDLFGQQYLTRAFDVRANKLGDGFVASWRDITEQKRSHQALEQQARLLQMSEARFRTLADNISQLAWIADEQGWIFWYNQRWLDYTGTTLEEMQGWGWQKVHHPDHVDRVVSRIRHSFETGEVWEDTFPLRNREGQYRWFLSRAIPIQDEDGAILQWFGTNTDITDYKQSQQALQQLNHTLEQRNVELEQTNQALQDALEELEVVEEELTQQNEELVITRDAAEAANQSKDEFVGLVAHELRSPLNCILGWAKLLRSRQFDAATTAKALETIERNTLAQAQLVDDLLDVSRIVSGKLSINPAPVNLATAIEAAIETVQPQAQSKNIHLKPHLTVKPYILGDLNRLQQIGVNLLTNAIKFTPVGGRVKIELIQLGNQVQLQVSDTGKGIAPEFQPQLFKRYQQGQKNTGSKDGLGLGLSIVKHLVELHGGTITAESQGVGQGATFTVRLPLLTTPAIAPENTTPPFNANALADVSILVVDDEPDMINLITFVLEEAGATVRSARSVAGAMAVLSEFQPNILLSDIAMPERTGYDLIQGIRRNKVLQSIPAIALTAYASTTDAERSLQAGFQRHLTKPVDPEVLVAAIVELVKLKQQNSIAVTQ